MLSWVCSGNAFAASLDNLLRAWKERSVLQAGQHIFRYGLKSYPFALGLVVVQAEGSAADAVLSADIVVTDILNALDLLRHPLRLTATLRS